MHGSFGLERVQEPNVRLTQSMVKYRQKPDLLTAQIQIPESSFSNVITQVKCVAVRTERTMYAMAPLAGP